MELSKKNSLIDELKQNVQRAAGAKSLDVRRDEDFGAYLTTVI